MAAGQLAATRLALYPAVVPIGHGVGREGTRAAGGLRVATSATPCRGVGAGAAACAVRRLFARHTRSARCCCAVRRRRSAPCGGCGHRGAAGRRSLLQRLHCGVTGQRAGSAMRGAATAALLLVAVARAPARRHLHRPCARARMPGRAMRHGELRHLRGAGHRARAAPPLAAGAVGGGRHRSRGAAGRTAQAEQPGKVPHGVRLHHGRPQRLGVQEPVSVSVVFGLHL